MLCKDHSWNSGWYFLFAPCRKCKVIQILSYVKCKCWSCRGACSTRSLAESSLNLGSDAKFNFHSLNLLAFTWTSLHSSTSHNQCHIQHVRDSPSSVSRFSPPLHPQLSNPSSCFESTAGDLVESHVCSQRFLQSAKIKLKTSTECEKNI